MPPPGKRAEDRKGWPMVDRFRFQLYRAGRLLYVVVPIVLVIWFVINDSKNTNRDEARKFQRCVQTVSQGTAQNTTNGALRDALLSSANQRREQAERTRDAQVREGLLENARELERSRNSITFAAIPDCRKTYPRGFDHADDFPDLAPARPPRPGQ